MSFSLLDLFSRFHHDQPPSPAEDAAPRRPPAPSANGDNGATAVEPPSANGGNGRDAHGRFTKGNTGGPGNPFTRRTAALRRALAAVVSEEDIQALVGMLLRKALDGDVAAAKVLLVYAIGKPTEAVDPDAVDLHEWRLLQQGPFSEEHFDLMMTRLPPDLACAVARAASSVIGEAHVVAIAKKLVADAGGKQTD